MPASYTTTHPDNMETASLRSLLNNPEHSDLEIRCDGRTYYAHRVIVGMQCPVLAAEYGRDGTVRLANERLGARADDVPYRTTATR